MLKRLTPLVMVAVLAGAALGGLQAPLKAGAVKGSPGSFGLILTSDRPAYGSGEPIVMTVEAVNESAEPVTLYFPTSQRYDFVISGEQGTELWRWSKGRVFATVLGQERIGAGRPRLTHTERVTLSLPPGRYRVEGTLTDRGRSLRGSVSVVVR